MVSKDTPATKPAKAATKRSRAKTQAAAPQPKAQAAAAAQPSASATSPGPQPEDASTGAFSAAGPETLEIMEALSRNLARAAMTAQGAIAEAALRQADRAPGLDADPFHVGPAMAKVMASLAGRPDALMQAQGDLWRRYAELWHFAARRAMGETGSPVATPTKGDKRFNAPDWTENPVFDVIKQSYLITSDWMNGLVARAEDIDPMTRRRVEFFTRMLTDALSPSNFLASNPEALKEALSTRGESLVRGMENFAGDLARGGGQLAISQTDYDQFEIGVNVAPLIAGAGVIGLAVGFGGRRLGRHGTHRGRIVHRPPRASVRAGSPACRAPRAGGSIPEPVSPAAARSGPRPRPGARWPGRRR